MTGLPLRVRPGRRLHRTARRLHLPGRDPVLPARGRWTLQRARGAYRVVARLVKPALRAWFPVSLEGCEHVPAAGPAILAANHRSNLDPPMIALVTPRPVFFMAKRGLFRGAAGPVLRLLGQFPVRHEGTDRQALRAAQQVVDQQALLGLFPEGTRGRGGFSTIHPGLAYILVRRDCPVLPVAVLGTERARRPGGWRPRATPVRVVVGPPLALPPPPAQARDRHAARRAATQTLRQALQDFLAAAEQRWQHDQDRTPRR